MFIILIIPSFIILIIPFFIILIIQYILPSTHPKYFIIHSKGIHPLIHSKFIPLASVFFLVYKSSNHPVFCHPNHPFFCPPNHPLYFPSFFSYSSPCPMLHALFTRIVIRHRPHDKRRQNRKQQRIRRNMQLKSVTLWTRIAVIPDIAPSVIPRTNRPLRFLSFPKPLR